MTGTVSPLVRPPSDLENESRVAAKLELAWDCQLHKFGKLSTVDFYATREGDTAAIIEIKCRTHATTTYPDVFLSMRKWLALALHQTGIGVPGIYVVEFTDEIRFIKWGDVDPRKITIAGRTDRVNRPQDIEPLILVPVSKMAPLTTAEPDPNELF